MTDFDVDLGSTGGMVFRVRWFDGNKSSHETVIGLDFKPQDDTEQLHIRVNGILAAIHDQSSEDILVVRSSPDSGWQKT